MKIKYLTFVFFIAFIFAATGCGRPEDQTQPTPTIQTKMNLTCPQDFTAQVSGWGTCKCCQGDHCPVECGTTVLPTAPICDEGYSPTYNWYSGCTCCNDGNECPKACL